MSSVPRLLSSEMPDLLPMQGRSPGLHISEVIKDLCIRLGIFEGDMPVNQLWMGLGNALEYAIVRMVMEDERYRDRFIRPGELEKDGMFGTLDLVDTMPELGGLIVIPGAPLLHEPGFTAVNEIKLSWMSVNQAVDSERFWRYWVQIMAYCWMWETTIGVLHVAHINGDYKYGKSEEPGPAWRSWRRDFTERELFENWRMLKSHGAKLVKARQAATS